MNDTTMEFADLLKNYVTTLVTKHIDDTLVACVTSIIDAKMASSIDAQIERAVEEYMDGPDGGSKIESAVEEVVSNLDVEDLVTEALRGQKFRVEVI